MLYETHEVKRASINCATSGDNTLVAAVTGKSILVLAFFLSGFGTAIGAYLKLGSSATALGNGTQTTLIDKSGVAGNPSITLPFNPEGWFKTDAGSALVLNLSGAQGVAGQVVYVEL